MCAESQFVWISFSLNQPLNFLENDFLKLFQYGNNYSILCKFHLNLLFFPVYVPIVCIHSCFIFGAHDYIDL